jgi:biopolymer transport protein ExbB
MFTEFNWIEATGSSPVFMVLVGCSVVTLAVALERAWYFWKRSGNPDETLEQATEKIRAGQIEEAAWTCESSQHPMGKVASEIFRTGRRKGESYEEKLQVALSQQKLLLERNLSILGTMAAIAPLIGLLGTVWGIMRAFHDMAATGSAAPTVVAAGVAEALITTAAGLVVAVPALVLYNHFANRLNVMLTVAENHTRTVRSVLLDRDASGDGDAGSGTDTAARSDKNKSRAGQTGPGTPEPAAAR